MTQPHDLSNIALGILAWRTPSTLEHTLRSYQQVGLLQSVGSVCVFLNEATAADIRIANEFELKFIASESNLGIGPALTQLVHAAEAPYFMFLEGDWLCVEPSESVEARLNVGMRLIHDGEADAVRFRHRSRHGEPLHSKIAHQSGDFPNYRDFLLDSVHWLDHPEQTHPEVSLRFIETEEWYFATSRYSNYTNNPCLYDTEFLSREILPRAYRDGIHLEVDLHEWWKKEEFIVAQGTGLFEHHPLEKSGAGYSASNVIKRRIRNLLNRPNF